MSIIYSEQLGAIRLTELNRFAAHIPPEDLTMRVVEIAVECAGLDMGDVIDLHERIEDHANTARPNIPEPEEHTHWINASGMYKDLAKKTSSLETRKDDADVASDEPVARERPRRTCANGPDCYDMKFLGSVGILDDKNESNYCLACRVTSRVPTQAPDSEDPAESPSAPEEQNAGETAQRDDASSNDTESRSEAEPPESASENKLEPKVETEPELVGEAEPTDKACRDCGETKPVSEFKRNRWGYTGVCRQCTEQKRKQASAQVVTHLCGRGSLCVAYEDGGRPARIPADAKGGICQGCREREDAKKAAASAKASKTSAGKRKNYKHCGNGEKCVAFKQTGEPTRLAINRKRTICWPCETARRDAGLDRKSGAK